MLSVSHLKSAGLNDVFLSLPEKQDEMVSANHSCLMAERKTSVSTLLRVFCYCCAELLHRPIIFHLPSFPGPGFSSPPRSWFSGTFSQADSMSLS